jgi:hypothetical protein
MIKKSSAGTVHPSKEQARLVETSFKTAVSWYFVIVIKLVKKLFMVSRQLENSEKRKKKICKKSSKNL